MLWLTPLLMALGFFQYLTELEVTPLSFNAVELREAFNATEDRGRLVLVMSPT